jgi:hypothetical protein
MSAPRPLRSLLGTACAVALTGLVWSRLRTSWSLGFFLLALVLFALALGAPRVFAPIQAAFDRFGHAVAATLTVLLLGLVFALVFVPGRLLLALLRRDPLHRRPDPGRTSYWEPLPPAGGVERFRRQF